jgi:sporulation protein YqfC
MVHAMEIPEDLAYQEPVITMTGRRSVQIENYRSLVRYARDEVLVHTVHGSVKICGTDLEILDYTADEMHITGKISSICVESR